MKLNEAIKRIKILMNDSCSCLECIRNKEAYKIILQELENRIPKKEIYDKLQELGNKNYTIIEYNYRKKIYKELLEDK